MSVFEKHRRKIARDTLRMPEPILGVMGGMTKKQARAVLKHSKEAVKEKHEHPWTTWGQAEKIASDHKKKSKETFLVELVDTAPKGKGLESLPHTISYAVFDGRSPSEVMRKFSKKVDKQVNLKEMRDSRYGRYVINACPKKANPFLKQFNLPKNVIHQSKSILD